MIEHNATLPDNFETTAQHLAREESERKERSRRAAKEARQELEWEYETYQETEVDRYIAANATVFEDLKNAKLNDEREKYSFGNESMARISAKNEIRKQITFLTFEEFLQRKKQGTDLFLKPVGPSPAPEVAAGADLPDDLLAADETREADATKAAMEVGRPIDLPAIQPAPESAAVEPETKISIPEIELEKEASNSGPDVMNESAVEVFQAPLEVAQETNIVPEVQTAFPEPLMIEFVSNPPPPDELAGENAEQRIA